MRLKIKVSNQFIFRIFVLVLTLGILGSRNMSLPSATQCESRDYGCQIQEIERELGALKPAHETNKQELSKLNVQLADLKKRITSLSSQLTQVEKDILQREEDLAYAREIFNQKASNHYRFLRAYDPMSPFLSSKASEAFREKVYRQKASDEDRKTMEKYAEDLLKLKNDKEKLEKNKASLAAVQKDIDARAQFLSKEVSKVENYIATLSARQNELSALKAGGFSTSVGDTPTTLEPCSGKPNSSNFCDPNFRPAFAGFSYGAPHFNGLSQYGAYGRAKDGQTAETILRAYYGDVEIKRDYDQNSNICVGSSSSNCVNVPLEIYTKRIYEMPGSWGDSGGMEALKAQAVAARSYALSSMARNGYICSTESCQVYKPVNKGGKWEDAVNATPGWVITKNGKPLMAKYASSAGGYIDPYTDKFSGYTTQGFWDTPSGQGGWPNSSYEVKGGSPWFYKGWYKSRSGATCGRSHPWLTSEEMADILNAWHVLYKGGGDTSRISPLDTNCWGGNPYSKADLQNIGGYTSVSGVSSVIYSNSGSTQSVTLSTNKGSVSISGNEFKKAFNLRAPGHIGLKSSLFNIERL